MKLTVKEYKMLKIKEYLKNNEILFLFNGLNKNSYDWISTEQELKNITYDYYKIFNKTSANQLNNSIYQNLTPTINGITFFVKQKKSSKILTKHILLTNFKTFLFDVLAVKFNNKLYSLQQIKKIYSLNYLENHLILYQFNVTNLKSCFKFHKFVKNEESRI